jgi:hypothetical protein
MNLQPKPACPHCLKARCVLAAWVLSPYVQHMVCPNAGPAHSSLDVSHETFSEGLIAPEGASGRNEEIAALRKYVAGLFQVDWNHDFGNHKTYTDNRNLLKWLHFQRARLDPSGRVWDSIAPPGFQHPR